MPPIHDPRIYMRMRGYPVNFIIECAACPKKFAAHTGITFPAVVTTGEVMMATFCSAGCYLKHYPKEQMWQA